MSGRDGAGNLVRKPGTPGLSGLALGEEHPLGAAVGRWKARKAYLEEIGPALQKAAREALDECTGGDPPCRASLHYPSCLSVR